MHEPSLTQEQKTDLTVLASGEADEGTTTRATQLLAQNHEAEAYFSKMRKMVNLLDSGLAAHAEPIPDESLSEERIAELARNIRERADRRWTLRPWAVAAGIALLLVPAVSAWRYTVHQGRVRAEVFTLSQALGSPRNPRVLLLAPGQDLTTQSEMALVTLPKGSRLILAPSSSVHFREMGILLQRGQCYVRATDLVVEISQARIRVAGEAVLSVEVEQPSYVSVYSGTAVILSGNPLTVSSGQHAQLSPFQITTGTAAQPTWLTLGLGLLKEQK